MQYTKVNCPANKYDIKCPYLMNPTGISVHNTYNDASAMSEISYMLGNDDTVSYHVAIDDYRAVQGIDYNRNTWNSGDGRNGNGNRNKISIEICYSKSGGDIYNNAENNAVEFIADLLKSKGWGIDRVSKHQDFNGKYCPHRILDNGWQNFINKISLKLTGVIQTTLQPTLGYNSGGYQVNTSLGLRVRSGPSTDYAKVAYLTNGSKQGIDRVQGNWGHLSNDAGWICLDFCIKILDAQPNPVQKSSGYSLGRYKVNSSIGLNVRPAPDTNNRPIKCYQNGIVFDTYQISDNWAKTPSGWVCLDYTTLIYKY